MMVEFTKTTLGDCISTIIDYRGKTPKKLGGDWANEGYRAFSAKNIKTGQIVNPESIRYIDENLYKSWMKEEIKRGDIIITSEAPFGEIYYWDSDEKIVLSQRLFAIRCAVGYYSKFIYYSMASPSFQSELKNRATGTTVFGLRQPELLKCELEVPDYPTQVKIAAILSSLDDKIELNTRMNKVLEEIARALFHRWFVAFEFPNAEGKPYKSAGGKMVESEMGRVPEGWRVGTIGEIVKILGGSTPDTTNTLYWENGRNPFCTPKDLSALNSPIILDTERHITDGGVQSISSKQLPAGTLLLSSRAPVGYLAISSVPISVNQGFIAMICDENISNVYIIQWLRENMEIIEGRANGSTFQEISKRNFRTIPFLIPSTDVLTQYNSVVKPLYNHITTLTKEIALLSGLRDTLLPKLMNGEIEIGLTWS